MRIISGTARGTKLFSLEGDFTRPTLDRVKEALFNILAGRVKESIVLDLFAGSGALGLECASRGARKVILCDSSKEAIKIIEKNIEKTKMQEKSIVIQSDFKKCIEVQDRKYDLILIDPPYKTSFAKEAIEKILEKDRLEKDGLIVVETDELERVQEELEADKKFSECLEIVQIRKYGRVKLMLIERKG